MQSIFSRQHVNRVLASLSVGFLCAGIALVARPAQAQTTFGPGPGGQLVDASTVVGEFTSNIVLNLAGVTIEEVVSVTLTGLTHTWLGDLVIGLEHLESGQSVTLTSPPDLRSANLNGTYTFLVNPLVPTLDEASLGLGTSAIVPPGNIAISDYGGGDDIGPRTDFSPLSGLPATGTWQLFIFDFAGGDTGALTSWQFDAITSTASSVAPEPGTLTMLLPGVLAGCFVIRRRTVQAKSARA
jgi:subtilisin-like proprotein convertase family protein